MKVQELITKLLSLNPDSEIISNGSFVTSVELLQNYVNLEVSVLPYYEEQIKCVVWPTLNRSELDQFNTIRQKSGKITAVKYLKQLLQTETRFKSEKDEHNKPFSQWQLRHLKAWCEHLEIAIVEMQLMQSEPSIANIYHYMQQKAYPSALKVIVDVAAPSVGEMACRRYLMKLSREMDNRS